ncbi:MAG: hypothetical protein BWY76_02042 [bacterium ADurb.Bin429]|nr:MAG: hypothetical protein BWY76_02042 [bacterium ADurb.Bin429]
MYVISYLAQDTVYLTAVQERLRLAQPPMVVVVARSLPELINQAQTLPLRAVLADLDWPRATWESLAETLKQTHPHLPVLALASRDTEIEWWQYANDLARLDDRPELFLFRLQRAP